jgi:hypothetical protein
MSAVAELEFDPFSSDFFGYPYDLYQRMRDEALSTSP